MADPTNVFAMDDIKFMTGYNVEPVVASETAAQRRDREVLRLDAVASSRDGWTALAAGAPIRAELKKAAEGHRGDASDDRDDVEVLEEIEEISAEVARARRAAKRRSSSS